MFVVYLLKDFLPILVFYIINHFYGLTPALISSIICVVIEIIVFKINKKKMSNFFKFSAILTIIFGFIDLYLQKTIFFKYESVLTNIFVGIYFGFSLFTKKPIIRQFAESWKKIPEKIDSDLELYFIFITAIWVIYFFIKAIVYGFVAYNYSFEKTLLIRIIFGQVTFFILLFISIFGNTIYKICSKMTRFLFGKYL